jgi:hypothetical protein
MDKPRGLELSCSVAQCGGLDGKGFRVAPRMGVCLLADYVATWDVCFRDHDMKRREARVSVPL